MTKYIKRARLIIREKNHKSILSHTSENCQIIFLLCFQTEILRDKNIRMDNLLQWKIFSYLSPKSVIFFLCLGNGKIRSH